MPHRTSRLIAMASSIAMAASMAKGFLGRA